MIQQLCLTKSAFSLVELSIVLVILGLLAGGILTGQSLIRAAELRNVATEFQRYQSAVQSFRDKYQALPGDMRNATNFWLTSNVATSCTSNSGAAASANGTCDGNGDGIYQQSPATAGASGEIFQFWRQLALAGLTEGSFTGTAATASSDSTALGVNAPFSKLSQAGWAISSSTPQNVSAFTLPDGYGTYFTFGAEFSGNYPVRQILRAEEAWNIDIKIDDGRPAYGKVIGRYWNNLCTAADDGTHATNDLAASYKLTDTTIQCALYFRQSF